MRSQSDLLKVVREDSNRTKRRVMISQAEFDIKPWIFFENPVT